MYSLVYNNMSLVLFLQMQKESFHMLQNENENYPQVAVSVLFAASF